MLALLIIMQTNKKDETAFSEEDAVNLLNVFPAVMGRISATLRSEGPISSPSHFQVLYLLMDGKLKLHEIAEIQSVKMPTMSRTIDTLVSRGWIERKQSADDRRALEISITKEGKKIFRAVEKLAVEEVLKLIDPLTKREQGQLKRGIKVLMKAAAR